LVKILPVPYIEDDTGTEYTPSSEMAETYFIGEVTEVKNSGGASSDDGLTVTLTDSFANQNVINLVEAWSGWSIGLYAPPGPQGDPGADGETKLLQALRYETPENPSPVLYNVITLVFDGAVQSSSGNYFHVFEVNKTSSTSSLEVDVNLSVSFESQSNSEVGAAF
jgi:hypothetical protein